MTKENREAVRAIRFLSRQIRTVAPAMAEWLDYEVEPKHKAYSSVYRGRLGGHYVHCSCGSSWSDIDDWKPLCSRLERALAAAREYMWVSGLSADEPVEDVVKAYEEGKKREATRERRMAWVRAGRVKPKNREES